MLFFSNEEGRLVEPGAGDWNEILDSKLDRVVRSASGSVRCDSSLVNLVSVFDLIDRFCLDHPRREMWTRSNKSPINRCRSYLDRVFVRRTDRFRILSYVPLVRIPDHKLVQHFPEPGRPYALGCFCASPGYFWEPVLFFFVSFLVSSYRRSRIKFIVFVSLF